MTLDEFRSDEDLVSWAAKLYSSQRFRVLMEAISESHPKNYRADKPGLPESDHSLKLGRIYGYDECLNNLATAAIFKQREDEMPEATFGAPPETP